MSRPLAVFEDFDPAGTQSFANAVTRFREKNIVLPQFKELRDPSAFAPDLIEALDRVAADDPDPVNLFRVHWFNTPGQSLPTSVPDHIELPSELTGTDARIVVALGNRFPMIGAHKVLAAYACLVARLVTGRFDPTINRPVWPSTGNYARGGVAISKIMGCRGVAVLPEGMSRERFEWLDRWVEHPDDIICTPGTEANVKEIYRECNRLEADESNVILNQFSEFSNHLAHYAVTGPALESVFLHATSSHQARLAAFVSASGSAGTLGAGDYLKDTFGTRIVAVEALEVPTMLYNGFGDHKIQGIGDKHVPLIHNVTNTDLIVGISDKATDQLDVTFNTPAGLRALDRHGVNPELAASFTNLGYSSICNILAAIKAAKHWKLDNNDMIITVATDGSELYNSEREKVLRRDFPGGFDDSEAEHAFTTHIADVTTEHVLDMDETNRNRIFNLGYFTWVEQQGIAIEDFERRRDQSWWDGLRPLIDNWDTRIAEFNEATGAKHRQ
jgi:cysteine synthase